MSYSSSILFQGKALSLKSNESYRRQRSKVVCCCPWSGSDQANHKKSIVDDVKLQKSPRTGKPASLPDLVVLPPVKKDQLPFNFISFLLSLGPDPARRLPPVPSLLDFVGLWHYLIRSLPYHYPLRELASKYGPLMHIKLGERSAIIVSSARAAKEVLKTHDLACADRPRAMAGEVMCYDYTDVLFSPYGLYWKEMRKVCNSELLGPKSTRSFEHIRKEEGAVLIRSIESTRGAPFNLTHQIVQCIGAMTSSAVLGKMAADKGMVNSALKNAWTDRDAIAKSLKQATILAGSIHIADLFPSIGLFKWMSWSRVEMKKIKQDTGKLLDYVIDEHRKNRARTGKGYGDGGSEDFVDVLLRMHESDHLQISITDDNIKAVIFDMSVGGSESVSTTVDWAMAELMKNPHVMAKAQKEIRQAFKGRETIQESEIQTLKYLKLVVKETLRLHPPNCMIPRACREEFEIDGYHIPLNAVIVVNSWAIARDPDYWPNPERFEPERFEESPIDFWGNHFEFLPFGSGKRVCPGITFAIADVEFLLAQLLYHFDWKLPNGIKPHDLDMTESHGVAVYRRNSLNLIAIRYDPATM